MSRTEQQQNLINTAWGFGVKYNEPQLLDLARIMAQEWPEDPPAQHVAKWFLPIPGGFRVSGYGFMPGHYAWDIAALQTAADPYNEQICARKPGVVIFAGKDQRPELVTNPEFDRGNYTIIRSDDGDELYDCHQRELFVPVGYTVSGGEPIGVIGQTGYAQGIHDHCYAIRNGLRFDWLAEAEALEQWVAQGLLKDY